MKRLSSILIAVSFLFLAACGSADPSRLKPTVVEAQPTAGQIARQTATSPSTPSQTFSPTPTTAPTPLPGVKAPDVASYAIAVHLDPEKHRLTGRETITYRNTASKAIPDLAFHLYLNAFKSEDTIFMQESGGQLRGFAFNAENNGWINVTALGLKNGPPLKLEPQADGTLARAVLPKPVAPGQSLVLEVSFEAQLPQVFARTGWALDNQDQPFFLVGQWFPKLGVWTDEGWNAYPFHGNAEFFADFGNYDVSITLPANYVTGATGLPISTTKSGAEQTVVYHAQGVIDFAWVASPSLKTISRKSGVVEVVYLVLPEHEWSAERVLNAAADALQYFGAWYGAYPYPRLTVVDVPEDGAGAGGMEYPTFVTMGASNSRDRVKPISPWTDYLAITTIHEAAHQWWQSMAASSEGEEPWLDEGFADYSTVRLIIKRNGLDAATLNAGDFPPGFLERRRQNYLDRPEVPMLGRAWEFPNWGDYVVASYAKPDLALLTLERQLGEPLMLKLMHTYFMRYQFGHPTTKDFREVAVEVSGQPLDWFFEGLVEGGETLNYVARSIQGETITVERKGELVIPAEITVTFEDGSRETVIWDGVKTENTIKFGKHSPVRSFIIDPQHRLLIELDWTDNHLPKK